jgi:thymidylate synthase ThyX
MKIIEPNVELWQQGDDFKAHVARCARVCYGRETGNDEATIKRLINDGHWSMFRHGTYYMIANDSDKTLETIIINYANTIGFSYHYEKHVYYITVNGNWVLDHKTQFGYLSKYIVPIEDFRNTEIGFHMMRYTFCVDTQISTSRELNRVSPNSIAEKSTRYVYEDGSICRPHWLNEYDIFKDIDGHYMIYKDRELDTDINHKVLTYIQSCDNSFTNYKYLVESGLHRQDARGVLPLDTATRCVYTYSLKEWRAIIDLRYYGTTGKPHPNAKLIAGMIRNNLMELGYDFQD